MTDIIDVDGTGEVVERQTGVVIGRYVYRIRRFLNDRGRRDIRLAVDLDAPTAGRLCAEKTALTLRVEDGHAVHFRVTGVSPFGVVSVRAVRRDDLPVRFG